MATTVTALLSHPVSRSVAQDVYAEEVDEGVGARVRRSIGSPELRNLTPFLLLDDFRGSEGAGFPDHPHRGQATVSYMLEGSSRHEDSAGHKGQIDAGGVQWMCAGRGVMHSEIPVYAEGTPAPHGLQLWVDLPHKFKMVEPSYQEMRPEEVPSAYPNGPAGPLQIRVISGEAFGVASPVRTLGGCWYFHVIFRRAGQVFIDLPPAWTAFTYVFKGNVNVGAGPAGVARVETYHTAVFSAKQEESGVALAADGEAELVIIAGEPLDQPVVQYGPFVMTSTEEIRKTILDYRMGINGFEKARTWKSTIGGR